MKKNEPQNGAPVQPDRSDHAAAMTPEELRLYREVLSAAYPKPKRDIRAAVMEAIRAEAAVSAEAAASAQVRHEPAEDTKILPPQRIPKGIPQSKAAAKAKRRTAIVRWGSLAASIVLVAAVGIRVLPSFLTKDAIAYNSAAENTALTEMQAVSEEETASETRAETRSAGTLYKSMITGAPHSNTAIAEETEEAEEAEEEAMEVPAEITADEAPAEVPAYAALIAEEPAAEEVCIEEAPAAEEAEEEAAAEAEEEDLSSTVQYSASDAGMTITAEDSTPAPACPHTGVFRNSYHEIPSVLIDEVTSSAFNAWANEVSRDDACAVNIYSFLRYFGITETMFSMLLANSDMAYYCDYPIDVLYKWTAEEADGYYRSGGSIDRMTADYFEYELKLALVGEIGVDAYTQWLAQFPHQTVRAWSISQFVRDHGLTEAQFLEVYDETAEAFLADHEGFELHEYDTTRLFVPNIQTQQAIAMGSSGYAADVSCRK